MKPSIGCCRRKCSPLKAFRRKDCQSRHSSGVISRRNSLERTRLESSTCCPITMLRAGGAWSLLIARFPHKAEDYSVLLPLSVSGRGLGGGVEHRPSARGQCLPGGLDVGRIPPGLQGEVRGH